MSYGKQRDPDAAASQAGLLWLVFSRVGLVAVLLVIEILLLLGFYLWFSDYFKWFATVQGIFSLIMVFYLVNLPSLR